MAEPAAGSGGAADAPFLLRAELRGHVEDVRGCMSCELGVVTASRDKTVRVWVEEGPLNYTTLHTLIGHKDYVGALAYIPSGFSSDFPSGGIASGSRDTTTIVWDASTATPLATLQGHQYQVTSLGLLPSGDLVSGSLDKTLKVWRGDKCLRTLSGHEGPVLCLAVLPGSGDVLSGSGDTTIRRWSSGSGACTRTYKGHGDTVRGLCLLPDEGVGFVSASHDMTCKVWSLEGDVLAELVGHTALVYAVAACAHPTAGTLVATGSEDNTSRVWTLSGQCIQVIEHIGCIWDVCFTASSDLVTACSDTVARVWSTSIKEDQAAQALTTTFHQQVKEAKEQRAAAAAEKDAAEGGGGSGGESGLPPGVKVEPSHSLQQPGTKDGQTKVVKEANGGINAYAWDAKARQGEKIGEVVAAPSGGAGGGTGAKKFHQGREWDHVFDVDIQEGAPPLKMALNKGDNPYIVADGFIEEHGLPPYFKEQIVQFIIQNTGQGTGPMAVDDMPVTGGGWDPLTGGGGPPATGTSYGNRPAAPPPVNLSSLPITGGFVDPYTGGGTSTSTTSTSQRPPAVFLVFDNVPPTAKLAAKVQELSAAVAAGGAPDLALTDAEVAGALQALLTSASQAASPQAPATLPAPSDAALSTLSKMLRWPTAQLFPALDLARLLALHPSTSTPLALLLSPTTSDGAPLATALTTASGSAAGAEGQAALQTALRLLANCFKQPALRRWTAREGLGQLDAFAGGVAGTSSKAVRLGWATLLHNWSVLLSAPSSAGGDPATSVPEDRREEVALQVLSALVELGGSCPTDDADALGRTLQALATLLGGGQGAALKQIANDLGVPDVLRRVHDAPESKQPAWRPLLETAVRLTALLK